MTLGTKGLIVDPIPSGGGIINGGARLVFDSLHRPMIAYHKSDADENMQLYVARFAEGEWTQRVITAWDKPVKFSGGGAMPFIGIRIGGLVAVEPGVLAISYRHRDYGSGQILLDETSLERVDRAIEAPAEFPGELRKTTLNFAGISVRLAHDLNVAADAKTRYVLRGWLCTASV